MKVTIKDVARRAGVSPSTVSRVISNNSRISEGTQKRVREAMEALGYYPHFIARSLVTRNTRTIGLILYRETPRALSNLFFPEVIKGIAGVIEIAGYDLLLATGSDKDEGTARVLELLRGKKVDGVIILSSRINDPLLPVLRREHHPFVVLGRTENDYDDCWINNDNVEASCRAVQYLISIGHRRIGMVTGPREFIVSLDRQRGYEKAFRNAGIEIEDELVVQADFTMEGAFTAANRLLDIDHPPTAIFAADDSMAVSALRACNGRGLRVPADISLMCFNDDPLATLMEPPLTTVAVPTLDLGKKAALMLLDLIGGKEIENSHIILPTRLEIRGTTSGI